MMRLSFGLAVMGKFASCFSIILPLPTFEKGSLDSKRTLG